MSDKQKMLHSLQPLHTTNATKSQKEEAVRKQPYRMRTFAKVLNDAESLPQAIRLFGDLIYKNEVTLLAGDTGVGKSILAAEIAINLASGTQPKGPFVNEGGKLNVAYIDYELSDRQFSKRFHASNYPDNLVRVDIDPESENGNIPIESLEDIVKTSECDVLIVDNIISMCAVSTKDAEIAIKIMNEFKRLQRTLGITIIAIAHTPKRYDLTKPLEISDVAGSKMITNLADSVFFIAASSKDKSLRYLKAVKQRNVEMPNEVFELELKTVESGVQFEYQGMTSEKDHLIEYQSVSQDKRATMYKMFEEGKSDKEISIELDVDRSTVWRNRQKFSQSVA